MKIGELARQTATNVETIRYYERVGLLPVPARTAGRMRLYETEDAARLRFIRRARQLGFTLNEVRAFLRLAGTEGEDARAEARGLASAHVAEIRARIADLEGMERVLSEAICECETGERARCPLIEVLSGNQGRRLP